MVRKLEIKEKKKKIKPEEKYVIEEQRTKNVSSKSIQFMNHLAYLKSYREGYRLKQPSQTPLYTHVTRHQGQIGASMHHKLRPAVHITSCMSSSHVLKPMPALTRPTHGYLLWSFMKESTYPSVWQTLVRSTHDFQDPFKQQTRTTYKYGNALVKVKYSSTLPRYLYQFPNALYTLSFGLTEYHKFCFTMHRTCGARSNTIKALIH